MDAVSIYQPTTEAMEIGGRHIDVVEDHFSGDSGNSLSQAETSPIGITMAEEREEEFLSPSKQFRCRDECLYSVNRNHSTPSPRAFSGDGRAGTPDFSLIPTWNSKFVHRLQKLKKKESRGFMDIDHDCKETDTIRSNRALTSITFENSFRNKDKLDVTKEEEDEGQDNEKENNNHANLLEEMDEQSEHHIRLSPLFPSGNGGFENLQQSKKRSSFDESKTQNDEYQPQYEKNPPVTNEIESIEKAMLELPLENCNSRKQVIPKIPGPVIMENIGTYVNHRRVWNSLASLNRETFAISKSQPNLYRPWPNLRWRATTTAQGNSTSALLQGNRWRRIARGAVQTCARPRTVAFGENYLCYGTDRGDVVIRKAYGNGSTKVLGGHVGCINSVKCCGNWFISAGDDLQTRIWNVTTMSCEAILKGHGGSITSIAVSTFDQCHGRKIDGCHIQDQNHFVSLVFPMLVATAGKDGYIHLYIVRCKGDRVVSTEHLATLVEEFQQEPVYSIVLYERDGRKSLLSGGLDGRLRFWDVDSVINCGIQRYNDAETVDNDNTTVARIHSNTCIYRYDGEIKSIAISRNKEQIAVAFGRSICYSTLSSRTLRSYDFLHHHDHNHRHQRRLEQQRRLRQSITNHEEMSGISSNGTSNNDTRDVPWRVLKGHSGDIRCIDISPDGRIIASACSDGCIRLWELGKGTWTRKWKAHNGFMVSSLVVSPDGHSLLSAGSDGTIAIESLIA